MKRWQKRALVATAGVAALGAVGYLKRTELILALAEYRGQIVVAPNQPIAWQKGPGTAAVSPDKRPPNIVFILFDDLGINDLSTFGGGIAGGRVPTPNIDRLATDRPKSGVFLNRYAINPVNGEKLPIWASDYVLADYGTGAIMAVPAHDQRDLDFALAMNLPVRVVVETGEEDPNTSRVATGGDGKLVNSDILNGLNF